MIASTPKIAHAMHPRRQIPQPETSGDGEVFCPGATEWCHALAQGGIQVETITRNVLDRFLS